MQIAILHNAVPPDARADESDVLVQVNEVRNALAELGLGSEIIGVDLNLQACAGRLRESKPAVVFNLIEALQGSDRLVSLAVAVIESLGIPLTGSSADSLWVTNHKVLAKEALRLAGLPTPDWLDPNDHAGASGSPRETLRVRPDDRFILKPVGEHASLGMDEGAVVRPRDAADLAALTSQRSRKLARDCFAERYIMGREFNVSLLADGKSCQVLPVAEIDFSAFPPDKLRIVDYKAKWDTDSFEFQHTPRSFVEQDSEPELLQQLARLACHCWTVFKLGGYARVDFRVDDSGQPWVLEVNTNPCLSPDAGFAAALRQAQIPLPLAIQRILDNALQYRRGCLSQSVSFCTDGASQAQPSDSQQPIDRVAGAGDSPARVPDQLGASAISWRYAPTEGDQAIVRQLVANTGFFYPDEVAVAEELVQERLTKGEVSGYHFVFAEIDGRVAGYACYGHIACTRDSYDLYWIAVDPSFQGQGIGRLVLAQSERCIQAAGGRRVYIETSNREQYQSTRGFYLRCGYDCATILAEFYGPGDDKVIYCKVLN